MKSVWLAGLFLAFPSIAAAQAIKPASAPRVFTDAEVAGVALPDLAFAETPLIADDYEKYFYFNRPGTSFSEAFADLDACDKLSSGISFSAQADTTAVIAQYGAAGAIGGALGNALADAVFGSAERRRQKRINIRNCMGFKGYVRYGLAKELWEKFHFEGSTVDPQQREKFLMVQARVASGPVPATKALEP